VARVLGTTTGYALRHDGAPGFTLNNIPAIGTSAKVLVDVQGTLLYVSDDTSPLDADGYPTALQTSAFSTR
jgi:hypothetical protein